MTNLIPSLRPTLTLIAAIAANGVIGKNNKTPWHLPRDMAYFKQHTLGKPILMGRKTFESIGHPLPGRQNIILTRDPTYNARGAAIITSLSQALEINTPEIMVIGGAEIYQQTLPLASRLHLTLLDNPFEGDTIFPNYDEKQWRITSEQYNKANPEDPCGFRWQSLERL